MKKFISISLFCGLSFMTFTSCLNDEDTPIEAIEIVKIDSVRIASDTMDVYQTHVISTFSQLKDNCEGFSGYNYGSMSQFEKVVVAVKFKTNEACGTNETTVESQLNFQPQVPGTYIFKFKNDIDSSGGDNWIEKKIVVK